MPRPDRKRYFSASYWRLRRRILDERGWRCEECNRAGRLELHHVDGDRDNDIPANLKILCRPCHFLADGRRPGPDRSAWRAEIARRLAE